MKYIPSIEISNVFVEVRIPTGYADVLCCTTAINRLSTREKGNRLFTPTFIAWAITITRQVVCLYTTVLSRHIFNMQMVLPMPTLGGSVRTTQQLVIEIIESRADRWIIDT